MSAEILIVGLAGITIVAVIIFALTSKKKTDERMEDPNDPNSSLAADGPSHRNAEKVKS